MKVLVAGPPSPELTTVAAAVRAAGHDLECRPGLRLLEHVGIENADLVVVVGGCTDVLEASRSTAANGAALLAVAGAGTASDLAPLVAAGADDACSLAGGPGAVEARLAVWEQRIADRREAAEVTSTIGVGVDVSGRRQAEQALVQTQKLESLAVLAGGIAHDFNNLLVAILGNAGLALMKLPPESNAREAIHEIELAGQRAAELARQMLAFAGKGRFVIQPVDLNELVEETAHLLRVSLGRRVTLRHNLEPGLPTLEADATQLRQVVMNLIVNASEAVGDGEGTIGVTTGTMLANRSYLTEPHLDLNLAEGRYLFLEVSDTGAGMDAETRERVFDPFFTTKFTGRGLGLAAVLGIVRGHRGAIKVWSKPGQGTTFRVLLPVSRTTGSQAAMSAESAR